MTDRFVDSSLAYQGAARGLGIDEVWEINRPGVEGSLPDLAVVLDVPVRVAVGRDTGPDDRIESRASPCRRRWRRATGSSPRGSPTASRS